MNNLVIDNNGKASDYSSNMKIPKPPRKGEVIKCQICGKDVLPHHFSKNETRRKIEFKWQIHSACYDAMENLAERSVPGLSSERRKNK